ncbi:MAG TPA: NADPH-dependent FMN reductase [Gemmatimonadaceae bacterium]|nr:NADPH-dependent FMN reductase [Gemmatimonadaceae bacterium]
MRILAISGSLRAASSNSAVVRAATVLAPEHVDVIVYDGLGTLPHFNPDLDVEPLPPAVAELRAQVGDADALLISSPEYAHGVPGSLKNALDWLVSGSEIVHKPVAVINASTRAAHAHASLTETLRTMSTRVVEDASVTLPLSPTQRDEAAIRADPRLAASLRSALSALARAVG